MPIVKNLDLGKITGMNVEMQDEIMLQEDDSESVIEN